MANRSFLYASDRVPTRTGKEPIRFFGISEYKWDIPVAFKLLLSGNPRPCPSSIWRLKKDIAIVADLEAGTAALERFLVRIDEARTHWLVQETRDCMEAFRQKAPYVVLEAGELFELTDIPIPKQIDVLLRDIQGVESSAKYEAAVNAVNVGPPRKSRLLARLVGAKLSVNPIHAMYKLGLGEWSDTLSIHPNSGGESPETDG